MPLRSLSVFLAFTTATVGVFIVRAENPRAPQPSSPSTDSASTAESMILQEGDGDHLVHSAGPLSGLPFLIKLDGQFGNTQDYSLNRRLLTPWVRELPTSH